MPSNSLAHRHLLTASDLSKESLSLILETTKSMEDHFKKDKRSLRILQDKILATLFFEPSTRTRLSFETAMFRFGGQVITVEHGDSSSLKKGESLSDTGAVVSRYADVIVMRHPELGSVSQLASNSLVPVINAGDGPNQHPTQALLDVYTISSEKGSLDGLSIGFVGDLKFGRTVHSLIDILGHYKLTLYFISAPELKLPEDQVRRLKNNGCTVREVENLGDVIAELDVLYVTRVQTERFPQSGPASSFLRYQITSKTLEKSKDSLTIMHPLPRVDEILPEIDASPKAKYFKQVENGIYLRMALLSLILGRL